MKCKCGHERVDHEWSNPKRTDCGSLSVCSCQKFESAEKEITASEWREMCRRYREWAATGMLSGPPPMKVAPEAWHPSYVVAADFCEQKALEAEAREAEVRKGEVTREDLRVELAELDRNIAKKWLSEPTRRSLIIEAATLRRVWADVLGGGK